MRPLVSVIIPAYNASATIKRALDSVAIQDYPQIEIVVIDDCSKDATAELVGAYGDPRIRLLRNARNLGECGAMNEGIAAAKGEYIAFLDADDEWRPTKLTKQIAALERNPAASFVTCAYQHVNQANAAVGEYGFLPADLNQREPWRRLLTGNFIGKPCVIARAAAMASAGPFDPQLRVAGDQDMWIRLAKLGELEFVQEVLVNVYSVPNSLMKVYAGREAEFVLPMVKRHVAALGSVLSKSEQRRIVAERYAAAGRDMCHSGAYLRGARYIIQGVMGGASFTKNAWFMFAASPITKAARAALAQMRKPGRAA